MHFYILGNSDTKGLYFKMLLYLLLIGNAKHCTFLPCSFLLFVALALFLMKNQSVVDLGYQLKPHSFLFASSCFSVVVLSLQYMPYYFDLLG